MYIHDYNGNVIGRTLPDLGHKLWKIVLNYFGYHKDFIDLVWLPDLLVQICVAQTVVFILFHPRRLQILRRLLFIYGLLNILRGCTVLLTTLADAFEPCINEFHKPSAEYRQGPMFPLAFYRAFMLMADPAGELSLIF